MLWQFAAISKLRRLQPTYNLFDQFLTVQISRDVCTCLERFFSFAFCFLYFVLDNKSEHFPMQANRGTVNEDQKELWPDFGFT